MKAYLQRNTTQKAKQKKFFFFFVYRFKSALLEYHEPQYIRLSKKYIESRDV